MRLTDGEQIATIFAGATMCLAFVGGVFKTSGMRGDAHNKWFRRLQYTQSALEAREIAALKDLRDALDDVLPQGQDAPALSNFDPSPLADKTAAVATLHASRERMDGAYKNVCRLGTVFTVLLSVAAVAVAALTLHYSELVSGKVMRAAGIGVGTPTIVLLLLSGVAYIVMQKRLADAQILAGSADPPEATG
jgi:hypothetical protein